jgi:hypothetical protein
MSSMLLRVSAIVCLTGGLAIAAPGDPFGGAETGCVPADFTALKCEIQLTKLLAKLIEGTNMCHVKQATAAFKGSIYDSEACEQKNKDKFDAGVAKYSSICGGDVLTNVAAQEATLLADQTQTSPPSLDALNGSFFCDNTSGTPIDSTGEEAGSVPSTLAHLKCESTVSRYAADMWNGIMYKCHVKAATYSFKSRTYDEDACHAYERAKFNRYSDRLVLQGICPPCLDGAAQAAIADAIEARADSENDVVFTCP